MSDNFPNISTNGGDMSFTVRDPNNSALDMDDAGLPSTGKTKIQKSADAPHPGEVVGYGYMSPELKNVGMATGDNTSGIPAAQPVPIMTFGDPNDTGLDFRDGMDKNSVTVKGGGIGDIAGYGFDKPNPMGS